MNMKNKEQLLYFFLQGKISLSRYDYNFMANLQTIIQDKNRVTSNQTALFDKLVSKYSKQLKKIGLSKDETQLLSWKTIVVESTPEYTGAVVNLLDEQLTIRVPFNKTFIIDFRSLKQNDGVYVWDPKTKLYIAPFSTTALKIAYTILPKYFSTVKYSDEIQNILNQLEPFNGLVWDPTLMLVNGNLVIAAINTTLGDLLNDVDLSLNPNTLFKLSQYGIKIDSSVTRDDPNLIFAASRISEIEATDLRTALGWMKNLGCTTVVMGRGVGGALGSAFDITNMVEQHGMRAVSHLAYRDDEMEMAMLMQRTSRVHSFITNVAKVVVIRDTRPIELK